MKFSKDKKQQRYQMIMYALSHGIKPTARIYDTTPKTVRKRINRFRQGNYRALEGLSRRPKHSPNSLPPEMSAHIVKLKSKYRRLGAEQVKTLENLPVSPKTIRKTWRNNGVSGRKRRGKHVTKQNLREVKKIQAI